MNKEEKDKYLFDLFNTRDSSAVEESMKVYGDQLMRFALSFLGDTRDAEECVNDTFLKTWNSIPPNVPIDMFSYLARICRCTAYDIIDKKQAAKRSVILVELTREMEECIPDNSRNVSTAEQQTTEFINEFLKTLPHDKRVMLLKRYWHGESIENIANEMGFSQSKVKTVLHRIRKDLKIFLEKKGVLQ